MSTRDRLVTSLYDELRINLLALPREGILPGQIVLWTVNADRALGPFPLSSMIQGGLPAEPEVGPEERAGDVEAVRSDVRAAAAHAEVHGTWLQGWLPALFSARARAESGSKGRFSWRFDDVTRRSVDVGKVRDLLAGKRLAREGLATGDSSITLRYFLVTETLSAERVELRWQDEESRSLDGEASMSEVGKLGATRARLGSSGGSVLVEGRGRVVFGVRLIEMEDNGTRLSLTLEHSRLGVLGPNQVDMQDYVTSLYQPLSL